VEPKVEPEEELQEEPEEELQEEPEEEPEVEFGEGVEDWPAEESEEEPTEDFHLRHPDEIIAPVMSRKRSATNVSQLSTSPPARTRQRHVLTEKDMQRMARHR
jgi:hypothetical protein